MNCPECGQPLRPIWHGLDACFCAWGGREPTADEIIAVAERHERLAALDRIFLVPTSDLRPPTSCP